MTLAINGTTGITLAGQFDSASTFGFKNRIINGGMVIDQRNAGASGTATGVYTVDRWGYTATQAAKGTWGQNLNSVTPPTGFINYLGFQSSSAYSVAAGDFFSFYQGVEGLNVADLSWGTANAKTITLSFQVYSSLTGTFGGAIRNGSNNYSYPFAFSIPVANTWTTISITVTGPTAGTFVTTNAGSFYIFISLGVGTTYTGTAGSWSANNYLSATGATSVVGTNNATFYITGVQLEKGSTATSFDFRPYTTELLLCQRYYWRNIGALNSPFQDVYNTAGGYVTVTYYFPVQMRSTPTINVYGTFVVANCAQPIAYGITTYGFAILATITATGRAYVAGAGTTTYFDTSGAEL
jgi:hypothetical protein